MSAVDPDLPPEPGEASAERTPERHDLDVESAFAEIVAHWDTAGPPVGSWPVQEDLDPVEDAPDAPGSPAGSSPAASSPPPSAPAPSTPTHPPWSRASGHGSPAAGPSMQDSPHQERWVPPDLPPITRTGWRAWLPWVGLGGAPVFFLVVVLAHLALPGVALLGGVVAFVAGFVTLVLRLPAHHDDDDGDGAVL